MKYIVTYTTWRTIYGGDIAAVIVRTTVESDDPRENADTVAYQLQKDGLWTTEGTCRVWTPPQQIINVVFFDG